MTKKQLSMLLSIETLFLVVPAVLLGTALGAGLTFLSLRLLMYSGSAPIQVSIPMKPLIIAILLWVVCTVLCRLVLFFIASHAPLTGEFQIGGHTSKKLHRLSVQPSSSTEYNHTSVSSKPGKAIYTGDSPIPSTRPSPGTCSIRRLSRSLTVFGRDKEAFHNGDLVLLTLIDDGVSHPLPPDGVVELRVKSGDKNSWRRLSNSRPFLEQNSAKVMSVDK
mgnify:CR=1 FL=1